MPLMADKSAPFTPPTKPVRWYILGWFRDGQPRHTIVAPLRKLRSSPPTSEHHWVVAKTWFEAQQLARALLAAEFKEYEVSTVSLKMGSDQ